MKISAIILTKNEEKNIERCVKSLGWCDEIVIIDDNSIDDTLSKAQSSKLLPRRQAGKTQNQNLKLKIYKRDLNADFAAQRNFGMEKARGDWILFVDADEIISEFLASEIKTQISKLKTQNYNSKLKAELIIGFYLKRRDYFMGKWLEHGETSRVKFLRLARRDAGLWKGKVHEIWEVKGEVKELENPILHYPHPTVSEFLEEVNIYTDIVVQRWKEERRKMGFWEILVYPKMKFFQNYLLRLGFLDGVQGLIMAIFMSFHSFLIRSKYWLMTNF